MQFYRSTSSVTKVQVTATDSSYLFVQSSFV
jgi:hypothetical protein